MIYDDTVGPADHRTPLWTTKRKIKENFQMRNFVFLKINFQDIFSISIEVDVSHCPTVECGAISKWLIELSNY